MRVWSMLGRIAFRILVVILIALGIELVIMVALALFGLFGIGPLTGKV